MPTLTEMMRVGWSVLEVLGADAQAAEFAKHYQESGSAIAYDDAVRLAFGLMVFRIPYTGDRQEPGGDIRTVRDHEMLAVWSDRAGKLESLVEESRSSALAFRALQRALQRARETDEPMPGALLEWALDVAVGAREYPRTGPGRSPHTNQVRDAVIVRAVRALVEAGLTATRNEASDPDSACDAVAQALQAHERTLGYAAVAKIWSKRDAPAAKWMGDLAAGLGHAAKG